MNDITPLVLLRCGRVKMCPPDRSSPELIAAVGDEGMFVATGEPEPVGSLVRFRLNLDEEYLYGTGEVISVVSPQDRAGESGMALRFRCLRSLVGLAS